MRYVAVLAFVAALIACHRGPAPLQPALPHLQPSTVLLLPPRDVIQKGKPHPAGAGSGAYLLQKIRAGFESKGWKTLTTDSLDFSNYTIASQEAALSEARRLRAHYVLQVVLGEFRDAAPMTFRPDFVSLQEAHFWDVENGTALWATNLPTVYQSNNLRSYHHLLDDLSGVLVGSITSLTIPDDASRAGAGTAAPAAAPSRATERQPTTGPPDRAAVAPSTTPRDHSTGCTTEQVLSMKNAGLSDDQIRRACER